MLTILILIKKKDDILPKLFFTAMLQRTGPEYRSIFSLVSFILLMITV